MFKVQCDCCTQPDELFTTSYVLYVLLALFNYLEITGNMKVLVSSKLKIGNIFNKSMLLKVL